METDTVRVELPYDGFHVIDAGTANFVVRRIVEARRYGDQAEAFAASEIRRAKKEEEQLWTRFGSELEAWANAWGFQPSMIIWGGAAKQIRKFLRN